MMAQDGRFSPRIGLLLSLLGAVTLGCAAAGSDGINTDGRAADAPPADRPVDTDRRNAQADDPEPFDYFGGLRFDPAIPTPADVLGYEIGEHFTRAADMVHYMRRLAETSDRVSVNQYGRTNQRRPLIAVTITAPANHARLQTILQRNRDLTDPTINDRQRLNIIIENNPAIVWFSYNVHGNEASTMETAIRVAYTMAAATNDDIHDILNNVVLVIDPLLNPDGHERYVNWYQQTLGRSPIANPDAAEHHEPWPGGRTNHYLFDLNRDWLWLIQRESAQRIDVYRRYRPHLHIDFHEQGWRSPYFLGAGDDPYNTNIPDETRQWIDTYGEANAEVFDRHGLVYSSRERFDYLYPGYGKVLPVYHGAVGMLAEQAGHSRAGLAIDFDDQYTLTLRDRARNHFLLSMSNLETTAKHRQAQLERFRRFFVDSASMDRQGPRAFFISPDNKPALLEQVWNLCRAHGIAIETLRNDTQIEALQSYVPAREGDEVGDGELPAGTWVIRADQPMGRLVRAIFEPAPTVTDKETYDITAWSVPVAFGLDAAFTTQPFHAESEPLQEWSQPGATITGDGAIAIIVDAAQHEFPRAIGLAREHDLFARIAGKRFAVDGLHFARGSLIAHRSRNDDAQIKAFLDDLKAINLSAHRASRGMTATGPVLGANENQYLEFPKVVLLRGRPVSSYSFGAHWFVFDYQSPLPYTPINVDDLRRVDLDAYNTVVLPNAWGSVDERVVDALKTWVREGGVLVASGRAAMWASERLLELEDAQQSDSRDDDQPASALTYEQRREQSTRQRIAGAQVQIHVDTTHPLSAGARSSYGVLKRGDHILPVDENGYVVARFAEQPHLGGVLSDENKQKIAGSPFMTEHRLGRGRVICFSEDLTFRGFQHGPRRLLLNAIIYGASR